MNRLRVVFAFVGVSALVLSGCSKEERSSTPEVGGAKRVTTVVIHSESREGAERVPGSVRSVSSATLEAKVSGKIEKLRVREGSSIQEGEILIELSAKEIEARLDQALASEKQARQDLERFSRLLPTKAVTKQDYDAVDARARMAEAGVTEARTMVGYTKIHAPFTGVVTRKFIEEGDLALPGKPLLEVERQDLFRFEADIPETMAEKVTLEQELRVSLSGLSEEILGRVTELSPITDPNSRTRHVKVNLPENPLLRSGQFGYLLVPLAARPSLRVPVRAIRKQGQLETTFVLSGERALLRLVRTGKVNGQEIEILSGLSEGEEIILDGGADLQDGDRAERAP